MGRTLPIACALAFVALGLGGPAAAQKRDGAGKPGEPGKPAKPPKPDKPGDPREETRLRAGAAAVDITPPVGTPMFAYTARSRVAGPDKNADPKVGLIQMLADPDRHLHAKSFVPSTGVHTRLYSRALAVEQDGERYVLAQVDLGGVPYAMTKAVLDRLPDELGVSEDRLILSATHTHSGTGPIWGIDNMGYGVLGGDLIDPRIFHFTAAGIAASIEDAIVAGEHGPGLVPARLGVGATELTDASRNRASEPFSRNEDITADTPANDPDLTVIRVDGTDGKPLAVWSNFAIHATSFGDGNYLFSGDNPGITERIVEKEIGHGALNIWTNGNEGDISPNGGPETLGGEPAQYTSGSFTGAHMAGRRVAEGVLEAWREAGEAMQQSIDIDSIGGHLLFDGTHADGEPVGPIPVLGLGVVAGGTCSPIEHAAGPGQGYKQYLYGHPGVLPGAAPVSVWRIGDLGITAIPSEVTKQMGVRIREAIRQESDGELSRVVMAGLSNGYLSYTSTPEEYDACQYEGSFTLFGRQQGPRYRDYTVDLTRALLFGAEPPASFPAPLQLDQGGPFVIPAEETPNAGTPVAQPEDVSRNGRATFSWNGGDRALDAPAGETFVTLERLRDGEWTVADTDDSFADTFERSAGNVWTETYQFDACDPLGIYRFRVTGRADRGSGPERYELVSDTFELTAAQLTVAGNRALYPDPGAGALIAVQRLVVDGTATLSDGTTVAADPQTGTFPVPAGASITSVTDGCGNSS